ncbi:glycosyltransferase family 39 protein [Gimesia panareensis]|uniref:glycosyltransferase family 39 protein n=1 Tax=Gimesia panareensis TaxID=2527978 RepID=UPI00118A3A56|nr:glycosyltransferase family 39 protein [Gimesia panareensis]QDU48406.1 hypothetical protein Pan110_07200 [Gimesia panareensis]
MNTVLPRIISGAVACAAGLGLWEIVHLKGTLLFQRFSLSSLAAACCVIVGVLGIAGCLAADHFWKSVLPVVMRFREQITASRKPLDHWSGSLLLSFSLIVYFVAMLTLLPQQPLPEGNDQAAFLTQARTVQEAGGAAGLLQQLFAGEYTEANQHPLYVAILSYFPDYEAGKRFSAMCGLAALLLFSFGIARLYGNVVGGLTGLLLAVNAAWCRLTGQVVCEGLLLLFVAGLWLVVLRIPDDRTSETRSRFLWIGAGLLLGLAWLTKGTALVLLLGVLLWRVSYAIDWRRCIPVRFKTESAQTETESGTISWKQALLSLALVIGSFIVIASPLLVRNARVYGSPTFNANSYLLFEDEFTEPHALIEQRGSIGSAARHYWQTHTITQMVKREVKGLAWQIFIFLRGLGPLPFNEGRLFFGLLMFPFLLAGLLAETGPARRLYLIWMLLFWLAFAWYLPIAAGERFLMPLLLPTLGFVSLGIVRVGQLLVQRRKA